MPASMRVLLAFAPIALLSGFVLVRALAGRPLSRRALDIAVALLLLSYLTVTAGLGLFWVARMDLPVFDWHYLFGYALLVVASAHVALQLRGLVRFFRPRAASAPSVSPARSRAQPGALVALLGMLSAVTAGALLLRAPKRTDLPARADRPPLARRADDAAPVVAQLYRDSSYSRRGLLRSAGVVPERPRETKAYPGKARSKLPRAAALAGTTLGNTLGALRSASRSTRRETTLADLSTLLFHANGITAEGPGYQFRAAASSGALYPTDIYLVSDAVSGLTPGVHYYDGPAHELVNVGTREAIEAVSAALPEQPEPERAPLLLVLGSTFDRTAWKYNVRTYRYLGLDAGHVALNLLAGALALELGCELFPVFDDARLAAALDFDPNHEAPLLVLSCGVARSAALPALSPRARAAPVPADPDSIELTRLSSALTSVELSGGFDWLAQLPITRTAGPHVLPAHRPSERDLFEVIRKRRSFREFDSSQLARALFASVLADAGAELGALRSRSLVELYVIVRAVEGIEPGSYRYDPEHHALSEPIRRGVLDIEAAGLDQALLGRAAFVLSWALVEERVGKLEGARDFRHACLEAGLSGEAAYLSATAHGLGISGVGAFYDDEVGSLLALGESRPRVIYLAGIGPRPP
jgi:SagB-type dehydrogenase family enzyme